MKLALIPPLAWLGTAKQSDYHLVLPQLINTYSLYGDFYRNMGHDSTQHVILDNGMAEGDPVEWAQLCEIAHMLDADEVVVPDVIGDTMGTIRAVGEFINKHQYDVPAGCKFMYVVQGQDYYECVRSIAWGYTNGFRVFGIPRHLLKTADDLMIRFKLVKYIQENWGGATIHFLGASSLWSRELQVAGHFLSRRVRGMDTSMPYNYGLYYKAVEDGDVVDRPDDYFNMTSEDQFVHQHIDNNIDVMMGWARGDQG